MRQRNTSGYPLQIPSLDPPIEVGAGEEIDHPERLAGFTPVGELADRDDDRRAHDDGDDLDGAEGTQEATP